MSGSSSIAYDEAYQARQGITSEEPASTAARIKYRAVDLEQSALAAMVFGALKHANVRHILDLILPHMSRWRSLEMKTLYASSLPVPRVDLVDSAPLLKELDLGHVVDDLCAETSAPLVGDFETPNLQTLLMGGRAFRDAYVRPFPQLKPPPILWQVGITDYHPRNGPFALIDLLTCLLDLPRLKALSLNNLQLDCTADVPRSPRNSHNTGASPSTTTTSPTCPARRSPSSSASSQIPLQTC